MEIGLAGAAAVIGIGRDRARVYVRVTVIIQQTGFVGTTDVLSRMPNWIDASCFARCSNKEMLWLIVDDDERFKSSFRNGQSNESFIFNRHGRGSLRVLMEDDP